jgi:GTP-binding protein HflX
LLHLVDVGSPDFEDKIKAVEDILTTLGLKEKKRLIVFNKIDKTDRTFLKNIEDRYRAVSISSLKKIGIDRLIQAIEVELSSTPRMA